MEENKETEQIKNIDISDFPVFGGLDTSDYVVVSILGGRSGLVAVRVFGDLFLDSITPVIKNGVWWVGSENTGVQAEGRTPQLRRSELGVEYRYAGDSSNGWRLLATFEDLKLKYENLTKEQQDEIRLRYTDLTEEQIKELQQPALDAIPSIKEGIWWIGEENTGIIAEGRPPELRKGEFGLEYRYEGEGDDEWKLIIPLEDLKLKFDDLTDEQQDEIRLKFEDLTEEQIKELQKPALDAAPSIRNGVWWIGGSNTGIIAEGRLPELRRGKYGVEYRNEEDEWKLIIPLEDLRLKFDDLTEDQQDEIRLKFSDLTEEQIKELQKPALDAIPSIRNGVWWIGGSNTGIIAEGRPPELRKGKYGLEYRYEGEGDDEWKLIIPLEDLRLKFDELTKEQQDELRLKFSDLTEEQIKELQKPALDARPSIRNGVWWLGESNTGIIAEGRPPELRKGKYGLEYRYEGEGDDEWKLIIPIDDLRLKPDELTPEQYGLLKLKLEDLTSEDIALLQQPAADMIAKLEETDASVMEEEMVRRQAEEKRVDSEKSRNEAEESRVEAEAARESEYAVLKEDMTKATENANDVASLGRNQPIISNGNWWVWDTESDRYKDTGTPAVGRSPKIENGTWWIWDDLTSMYVDTGVDANSSRNAEELASSAKKESAEALTVATNAKNAISRLEGLADADLSSVVAAEVVTQVETNKSSIALLYDRDSVMSESEYILLESEGKVDADKFYFLFEE